MTTATASPEIGVAPIEIRGLHKEYGHGDGVHGLDLTIPEGCSFGLLGPNGAGKSTTIKVLMGLTPPTSGEVRVLGHDVRSNAHEIRLRVGYVPERHHIYPWMTIAEVLWFTRSFYPHWDDALCETMLREYGLDPRKKVKQLSHGMTTKLALILALCHDPDMLILDEPTTGLDPLIREEFLEGVNRLIQIRPRTVLFSSHIMSDIEKVADTIGIINEGRLLVCASRDDLLEKTRDITVTLKPSSDSIPRPDSAILFDTQDRVVSLTVFDMSETELATLRSNPHVERVEVSPLNLEAIFKAFIKGARRAA
ncbi:MAG: tetronasin ABC transporter ATP-binding protein [Candidatus Hydrogenedentota bacterium]